MSRVIAKDNKQIVYHASKFNDLLRSCLHIVGSAVKCRAVYCIAAVGQNYDFGLPASNLTSFVVALIVGFYRLRRRRSLGTLAVAVGVDDVVVAVVVETPKYPLTNSKVPNPMAEKAPLHKTREPAPAYNPL